MNIELTYIEDKQNVWFHGSMVIVVNTRKAIWNHVDSDDKQKIFTHHTSAPKVGTVGPKCWGPETGYQQNNSWGPKLGPTTKPGGTNCDGRPHTWGPETGRQTWGVKTTPQGSLCTFINESGFYSLISSSLLETAKKFKPWVTSQVLPSIRKYGEYKQFDNPYNKMIMIGNETDLHYKVVGLIRRFYPDSILVAVLGENQDTEDKRLDSYRKGYMKGQPDLMILNCHKDFIGLGIEFKSPTGNNNNTLYLKRVARIVTETSKLVRPNSKYLADVPLGILQDLGLV